MHCKLHADHLAISKSNHRFAKFAGYTPLFPAGVSAQHMLPSEARANWSLFEWIIDLHSARQAMSSVFAAKKQHLFARCCTHRDFAVKECLQCQVETSKHLRQKKGLGALIND